MPPYRGPVSPTNRRHALRCFRHGSASEVATVPSGTMSILDPKEEEMLERIRRRLTFAHLIAIVALFVALGGTVYAAGKINGRQIKPNSVPGNRLKKDTVTGTQVNEATLSGVSASSLANVTYVTSSGTIDDSSPTGTPLTATCPAGTKVMGGGAQVSDEQND